MQTFEHSFHGFFSFLERFSSLDLQVDRVMKRSFPFVLLISTLLLPPRVEICCFMSPLIILTFLFSFRSKFIIDETMHFSSLFTNWFGGGRPNGTRNNALAGAIECQNELTSDLRCAKKDFPPLGSDLFSESSAGSGWEWEDSKSSRRDFSARGRKLSENFESETR